MLARRHPGIPPAGACIPLHTGPFITRQLSWVWYVTRRGLCRGQAGGHPGTKYDLFPVENLSGQLPLGEQRIRISTATFGYRSIINSEKAPDFLVYFPNEDGEVSSFKSYLRSTRRIPNSAEAGS